MYICKESILKAYELLSKATPTILNNFSAIQYFLATDRYFKENNGMPCDSSDTASKSKFYSYVGDVISLDDNRYLSSFKTIYEGPKSISSTVSSNFFSGSSVEHSNNTSGKRFDYPKKGPLLYAMDGKVFKDASYYANLSDYLPSDEEKFALAVWLLRKESRFRDFNQSEFRQYLGVIYSADVVNALISTSLTSIDMFQFTGEPVAAYIGVSDISPKRIIPKGNSQGMDKYPPYLTAIRTKPFLLLAGISGTGKSRIVRKLAQATDDIDFFAKDEDRWKLHKPANFELIQVKPNWHNSMDVVGFQSNIPEPHYEFTPFVDFVVKAWCHGNTPFFLCLDEMNLAPVEEYFAEFLSAIESRSVGEDGEFETDPIIKPFDSFGTELSGKMMHHFIEMGYDLPNRVETRLRKKGLTLPKNLIVMGTVNMDETTFSFSRKVLDRAMSIEMNEVNYDDFIEGKTEYDIPRLTEQNELLVNRPISAQEVKEGIESQEVMEFLKGVNEILEGTPFKLGYRAANEAILYVAADKQLGASNLKAALDNFTLMKILSRIEGDDSKLVTQQGDKLLDKLYELLSSEGVFGSLENSKSLAKLTNMQDTLKRDHFVSFWG